MAHLKFYTNCFFVPAGNLNLGANSSYRVRGSYRVLFSAPELLHHTQAPNIKFLNKDLILKPNVLFNGDFLAEPDFRYTTFLGRTSKD